MVNSLWTNFLVVFRDELSYTGYSVKYVPIRTRPAFSNGPLCSIVSLKLRVRNYTLKFPFFFQVHIHSQRDDTCTGYSTVPLVIPWRQFYVIGAFVPVFRGWSWPRAEKVIMREKCWSFCHERETRKIPSPFPPLPPRGSSFVEGVFEGVFCEGIERE